MGSDRDRDARRGDEVHHRPVLSVSYRTDGARAVIEIDGEVDLSGVDTLKDEARRALTAGVAELAVDASRVRFIDSVGLTALLAIRSDTTASGIAFRVIGASDHFLRIVKVAGLDDVLFPAA